MALKADNFYVEFGPGLYLDSKGKIVDKLPSTNHSVGRLPVQLNLPDEMVSWLKDKELTSLSKVLKDASPVLDDIGIDERLVKIIAASIDMVVGLASVYGTIGAAANLLQALGVFGNNPQQNLLTSIYQVVQNDYELQKQDLKNDYTKRLIDARSTLGAARWGVNDYVNDENVTKEDTTRLLTYIDQFHALLIEILQWEFQQDLFVPNSYFSLQSWGPFYHWLELHPDAVGKFPEKFELRGVDLKRVTDAKILSEIVSFARWDYTAYIGIIFETISALLVAYKALDPAYRTTRRFAAYLEQCAKSVKEFGELIVKHILWTREWDHQETHVWDYQLEEGWPVGAVNACSGASAITVNWKEGIETTPVPTLYDPVTGDPLNLGLVTITNMEQSLERVRRKRFVDWLSVLGSSGAPKVLQMAKLLEELSTVPDSTETVEVHVTPLAKRAYFEKRDHKTPESLGCDQLTFVAAAYLVKRKIIVSVTLQPERYQDFYTIPYTFAVEAYATGSDLRPINTLLLDRIELEPGTGTIVLNQVASFDWEVKSSKIAVDFAGAEIQKVVKLSKDKYVQMALTEPDFYLSDPAMKLIDVSSFAMLDSDMPGLPSNFTRKPMPIEYTLTVSDGEATFQFNNFPEEGNCAGVFVVIEEQPRGANSRIRTLIDISMIGTELHLPPGYFDYIAMCRAKSRVIIKQIEHEFLLKEKPIPPWDPAVVVNPNQWVKHVLTQHPGVLKGELLQQAKLLAKYTY